MDNQTGQDPELFISTAKFWEIALVLIFTGIVGVPTPSWSASGTIFAGTAPYAGYGTIQEWCDGGFPYTSYGSVCTGRAICTLAPVNMYNWTCPDAQSPVCEGTAKLNSENNACEGGPPPAEPETVSDNTKKPDEKPPQQCPRPPLPIDSTGLSRPNPGLSVANPILPATGEKVLTHVDYTGAGSNALSLKRTYRSGRALGTSPGPAKAGLGLAWSHNYSTYLWKDGVSGTANSRVMVLFGDGSARNFGWDVATSTWLPTNSSDALISNTTGLQYLKRDDDTTWQFDAADKLQTVTQRNGWVTSYSYSTTVTPGSTASSPGLLIAVSSAFGRELNFRYNGTNQLTSVRLPDGRIIGYSHDGTGSDARLTAVSFPVATGSPVSKTYLYEISAKLQLLTGIVDENGSRLATYAYDGQGRGVSTQHAGGADLHTVSYGSGGDATVTDPLGTQRTFNYGVGKGKLAVTGADKPSGSGNSSAASRLQDVNGLITQETDFLGVNTMYTWDIGRRLPVTITKAAGLPEAQVSTTQWHANFKLPVLVTEAGKTTAFAYDGLGNKLSQTITDTSTNVSRTTSWTYNSQGLPLTLTVPGGVTAATYSYYGSTNFNVQAPGSFDPHMASVTLLLNGAGADGSTSVLDSSFVPVTVTAAGNARISTTQSKFGGSSLYFDGVRDYVSMPAQTSLVMGASDFTIEMWIYRLANGNDARLWSLDGDRYADVYLGIDGGNLVAYGSSSGGGWDAWSFRSGIPIPNAAWTHVALARSGGTVRLFVNGIGTVMTTSLGTTALYDAGFTHVIGGQGVGPDRAFNGYIDEVRVTKGVGRYTTNFVPPTQAFPNVGPIVFDLNAVGHTTGDLQSVTNAAGHVTQYTQYDRAGRVRQMIDPKGVVTDTTYTPRGWLASTTVTPPGGAARTTTYTYDNAGQLTGVVMPDATILSYSYDAAHRLTGVTDTKGNTATYTLDNMGNKVGEQVKDPQGNLQRNITRVYDVLNRVQQTTGASN